MCGSNIYERGWPDVGNIIDNVIDISNMVEEERSKPDDERNPEREFELVYAQFVQGLKLSTGYTTLRGMNIGNYIF
ncbi:MAG: hypothetical protein J6Y37_16600 [Paludibacteraceae bacterium]|nr:hypothetical protein [Paludibacteraceae bacterium]